MITSSFLFSPIHIFILFTVSLTVIFFIIFVIKKNITYKYQLLDLLDEKERLEIQLLDEKHQAQVIFDKSNVGIALLNANYELLKVNESFCKLLGYSNKEIHELNYYSLVQPDDLTAFNFNMNALKSGKISTLHMQHQVAKKEGGFIWGTIDISIMKNENNEFLFFIMQLQDITLQKNAEVRLEQMAYHDSLTGVANRNRLEQFINHSIAVARRYQNSFALLFLDLDRFKTINDTLGHEAGDTLLQIVADRLKNSVRSTDMVARLGGDEFVLLVSEVKKTEDVALIAQKILTNILKVIVINGQEIYITTSIGISLYPHDGQAMQTLMKNADLAVYRAKEQGSNNYQFYTVEMTSRARQKMALSNALMQALVKEEFLLYYQPKLNIKTRRITGIEALLRWKNEVYKEITTDEIINLAEETGLIIPVSNWILKTACAQLKVWHDLGMTSLTMAINISARQFKQRSLIQEISEIIKENLLPPSSVEVEVKESVIMKDTENVLSILYALKDMGVKIAIDDFGTGYWSLGNLRRLTIDKIKIDKTFIRQLAIDESSTVIISAIIAMINRLGITSIAEGVETKEQYELLAKEGCTEIQGYYLTKPINGQAMTEFLKHPLLESEKS